MKLKQRLGHYLLEQGLITKDQLYTSLERQKVSKEPLGNILVQNGFITQKQKIEAIQEVDIDQLSDESTLITRCPANALIDTETMILVEDKDTVYLATRQNKFDVEKRLVPYYPGFKFSWSPVDYEHLDKYLSQIEAMSRKNVNRVDWLLRKGLKLGASDLHIEPGPRSYVVFMRIDGVLKHVYEGMLDEYQKVLSQIKERSNLDSAERRVPQDGGFSIEHHGRGVDLRVATTPSTLGEKIVIRILDPENTEVSLSGIGITRLDQWEKGFKERNGICLICGPTGSGKTTTLNATVRSMDRFGKAIYTIEDPVEYDIPFVTQINANHATGMDFARGLKAMMRMDPDVIIVGEIRDLETAHIAIKAAETGHLVIGTLHTGSIVGALERLRDIGVDPNDIKGLIRSIMVQSLVRKTCGHCHGEGSVQTDKGFETCDHCEGTGKKGRVLVSEVNHFASQDEVMGAIRGESNWPSMIDDLISKYEMGLIDRSEVVDYGTSAETALIRHENQNKQDEPAVEVDHE